MALNHGVSLSSIARVAPVSGAYFRGVTVRRSALGPANRRCSGPPSVKGHRGSRSRCRLPAAGCPTASSCIRGCRVQVCGGHGRTGATIWPARFRGSWRLATVSPRRSIFLAPWVRGVPQYLPISTMSSGAQRPTWVPVPLRGVCRTTWLYVSCVYRWFRCFGPQLQGPPAQAIWGGVDPIQGGFGHLCAVSTECRVV